MARHQSYFAEHHKTTNLGEHPWILLLNPECKDIAKEGQAEDASKNAGKKIKQDHRHGATTTITIDLTIIMT